MFSVVFPGQGSQVVGMTQNLYLKYELIKKLYKKADEVLDYPLTKLILSGPKEELEYTENTQPAVFLVGYCIFNLVKKEFGIDLNKAKYFAGHSLGEYTALACSEVLTFEEALKILKIRGRAMQNAVPIGYGGMIAILGSNIKDIENIIYNEKKNYQCFVANDNSESQVVVSGTISDIDKFSEKLKSKKIKNIKLNVSAPFHCKLMNSATDIMKEEISKVKFNQQKNILISNVTAKEVSNSENIKKLLIEQIESRVRWRESVKYMLNNNIDHFIEMGPGKVLSGLIKRIDKSVKVSAINEEEDIKNLIINDQS
tara:strand:- start:244 stop:1182 length:939 start_codon:yes stop_codon:yes gene_type:complete